MTQGKPAVVVLAGGRGARIGGGKPARMLGGRTLLDRALEQARTWSGTFAVAGRGVKTDALVIDDDPATDGPLGGLASALRFAAGAGAGAVLTIPCDTPFLPETLMERLTAEIDRFACALPESGGRLHPVCGLWRVEVVSGLAAYASAGRRSLIGLAETVGFAAVRWPTEPFDPFFNINTPEDLALAERLVGAGGNR
ncbi:MAG: molybdenum cofactor guanylyltransferase [Caulobacteraceae bacterium]